MYLKNYKKIKTIYQNGWKNYKFDNTEIDEQKFHQYRIPILIDDTDINKTVVFNKFSFKWLQLDSNPEPLSS